MIEQHVKVCSHVLCVFLAYSLTWIFLFNILLYECWWQCSFLLRLLASIYGVIHLYVESFESFPQPLTVACLYFSQWVFTIDMAYVRFTSTWSDDNLSCNGQCHLQSDVPCYFKMTAAHFSPRPLLESWKSECCQRHPSVSREQKISSMSNSLLAFRSWSSGSSLESRSSQEVLEYLLY